MNRNLVWAASAAALMCCATSASAADASLPPLDDSSWQITVAPYVWAAGIEGKSGLFGFPPQDIDVSFVDTLENLEMTFSGVTEMRKGPISFSTDILYGRIGPNINTPKGILATKINATGDYLHGHGGHGLQRLHERFSDLRSRGRRKALVGRE